MKTLNFRRTVFLAIGIMVAVMILITTSLFGMAH
jgi:threonine/homoserine/homoserine lactone efflux protein